MRSRSSIIEPTVTLPSAEFKRVFEQYVLGSTRTFLDSMKSRLRDVIIRAYQYTKVAAKEVIAHRLGVISQRLRISKKSGKTKGGSYYFGDKSLAYRIVQKRYFDVHGKGMPNKEAQTAADKFVRSVLKTVGFIRSGWIPVLRRLNSELKSREPGADFVKGEQRGRPKGYLRQLRGIDRIMLEAGNTTKAAGPIGEAPLARALAEVQAGMEQKLAQAMQPELAKINGKVIR